MKTKVCSKCKKCLANKSFSYRGDRPHLLRSWCKACVVESGTRWQKTKSGRDSRKKTYLKDKLLFPGRAIARMKEYRKLNPEKFRDYELKEHYGITLEQWKELLARQNHKCAICGTDKPNTKKQWFTDHDHKTKKVRGILCGNCNSVLGYATDSIEVLLAAIRYLKEAAE